MTDPTTRHVLAFVLSLVLGGQAAAQTAPAGCRIQREDQAPLVERFGRFTTPVTVNDTLAPMLVDTGAQRAFLSPQAADRLKLPYDMSQTFHANGIAGRGPEQHPRIADAIVFGGATWPHYPLQTAPIVRPEQAADPSAPVGLIGADMLSAYDVELDFPAGTITLYTVSGCSGRFAPWTGGYDAFPGGPGAAALFIVPVQIDGHWLKALVDTGANTSSISLAGAQAAGADAETLKGGAVNSYIGAQGDSVAGRRHRFTTFSVGAATYRNVQMSVLDANFGAFDVLLGMDFLRTRRLWLSYGTGQLFIQPATPKP